MDKKQKMVEVIKKSGKKQAFSPGKIRRSIEKAAKDAKLAPSKIKQFVKEIANPVIAFAKKKRTIKATALRKAVLGRLERKARKVASAWRRFDRKRKIKK